MKGTTLLVAALTAAICNMVHPLCVEAFSAIHGVYVIDAVHLYKIQGFSQYQIDSSMLADPSVDGISIRVFWSDVEPSDGDFEWSNLDNLIAEAAAAGKQVVIRVTPGYQTPTWLFSEGAQAFSFLWDQSIWGPGLCTPVNIPVPWDPIYLSKWTALIQATGTHYDGNPTVQAVKIQGINSEDEETNLPLSVNKTITDGTTSCVSNNDVANWQAIGYTRTLIENTWLQIAQVYQQAFPNEQIEAVMQAGGFPPIDTSGTIYSSPSGADTLAPEDIVTMAVADFGSQFILQNDALSDQWIWSYEEGVAGQVTTGYQTISALGSNLEAAMFSAVVGGNAAYFELYEGDILDLSMGWLINDAHVLLPVSGLSAGGDLL